MTDYDKIKEEIDSVLRTEHAKILADHARRVADMMMLAVLEGQSALQAILMKKAHDSGPEYFSAVLLALVLNSRDLARGFSNNPDAVFTDALKPCETGEPGDKEAHEFLRRFMSVADEAEALTVGMEVEGTLRSLPGETGARMAMHMVHGAVSLVRQMGALANDLALQHIHGEHDDH